MKSHTERRWNLRNLVQAEVILHSPRIGVIRTNTRDLSYGGMRLETRLANLGKNCHLRATFVIRQGGEIIHQSIDSRIIHTDSQGCGVMFVDFDRDTFMLLHALGFPRQNAGQLQDPMAA